MDDGVLRTDVTLYNLRCNTEELYLTLMKAVTTYEEGIGLVDVNARSNQF